ncbi:MAG: serine/threonine protein kinase, partial [Streptosporangiaceae bacterium]
YRAPEQLLGGPLDERTDLYALGVLLFEMLTGAMPYSGASASELLMQQLQQSAPSPRAVRPDVPKACAWVLMRALAREPAHRFARAEELAAAFREALAYHQHARESTEPQMSERALPGEERDLPSSCSLPAPASLSEEIHSSTVGRQDEQDTRALPVLAGRGDADGAGARLGEPAEERANTALVQALSSEGAATAAPARVRNGQHQMSPTPFPPVAGSSLTQSDLRRIAALPWPISRRGALVASRRRSRIFALCAAIVVIGIVAASLLRGALPGSHQRVSRLPAGATPGQVTLFADPLTKASHSPWWPTVPATVYSFTQDAYVITGASLGTVAVLAAPLWESPITYSITARASSDPTSATSFGLLFRCGNLDEEGSPQACYSFEVSFTGAGDYRFSKYDALTFAKRQAGPSAEWSLLWRHPLGPEFHEEAGGLNTLTVIEQQQAFTLIVNGKRVGQVGDATYHGGMVGIIVGGPGAVVAFSRLTVSRT